MALPRLLVTRRWSSALAPLAAAGAGLAVLVAHPPVGWWPTTFLAPALLLVALQFGATSGRSWLRAAGIGAVAGVVAYAPMIGWLIAPAGLVGWGLLTAVQVAWMSLTAVLVRPFLERPWMPVAAAVVWTGVDAWRGIVPLNGFGWGSLAYAHVDGSWLLASSRLVGGRGITFLVVLIGAAGYAAVRAVVRGVRDDPDRDVERAMSVATVPFGLLVGGLLVSVLATIEPPPTEGTLDVLVVQGNDIRHWEEQPSDPPLQITTAQRDLTLAAVEEGGRPDLTVWPESSIDRDPYADRDAPLSPLVDEAAAAAGTLLAGASLDGPDPRTQRYIAALHLEDGFTEVDRYVKRRLVPFGEFVPFRRWLDWFPPLEQVPRDAQPGEGPQVITLADGTRLAVLICFETLFADVARSNILAGDEPAQLLLALTNDASFRDSAEPAQHLAQSRLRAVESGRWTVHASLSGTSAFIDPDGVVYDETEVFTQAAIRRELPLADGRTPYLIIGDVVGVVTRGGVVVILAWLLVAAGRRRRSQEAPSTR